MQNTGAFVTEDYKLDPHFNHCFLFRLNKN